MSDGSYCALLTHSSGLGGKQSGSTTGKRLQSLSSEARIKIINSKGQLDAIVNRQVTVSVHFLNVASERLAMQ